MAPTLIEGVKPDDEISTMELFGPIACLYRVKDFRDGLAMANHSPYGLTACVHTRSIHRATEFVHKVQAGVAVVNAGTYGSEPHMPFGGLKQSGNGSREPGTEALDVYSEAEGHLYQHRYRKALGRSETNPMENSKPTVVALIPARAGSKRVPDKNVRPLAGHPLMAYSIAAALQSGVFSSVVVSTDSEPYARIAKHYGADVPFLRPDAFAGDLSPDIEWVEYTLKRLKETGNHYDCFSILRPTSPFRLPETIRRAWEAFLSAEGVDSLRAVEKCTQHPGKMWVVRGGRMHPLLPLSPAEQPWHSSQYQALAGGLRPECQPGDRLVQGGLPGEDHRGKRRRPVFYTRP
jgi:CMP-N,N'-diacetyllegionaminic acid synthase